MAGMLLLTEGTLRKNRSLGKDHPPFIRLSDRRVLYPKKEFERWLESRPLIREIRSA